jgi:hypothetical protein
MEKIRGASLRDYLPESILCFPVHGCKFIVRAHPGMIFLPNLIVMRKK